MQEETVTTKTYALSQGGCLLPAVMSLAGCPGWERLSLSLPSVRTRMRAPDLRWSWLASSSPALFHVRNWKITDTLSSPEAPSSTKWLLELRKVTGTVCVCEQEKDTFPCEHSEKGFRKESTVGMLPFHRQQIFQDLLNSLSTSQQSRIFKMRLPHQT